MNLTGNGNVRVEDIENMEHKHSGIAKRDRQIIMLPQKERRKINEFIRN